MLLVRNILIQRGAEAVVMLQKTCSQRLATADAMTEGVCIIAPP